MVVEMKTKEEILQDKTYRERRFADYRIDEMQREYDETRRMIIPLSGEYYSKGEADKDYLKKLEKIIRDVMIASLKKRDEDRMKQNVEKMVDDLKKTAEEGSSEQKE
ncbi:hypothetical protein Hanom_Chr05g00420101 [Helianthus anomalus]